MERVLAPVFVVIVLCAGLSLDFYSQRRANPGLSAGAYVQMRLAAVLGPEQGDTETVALAEATPDAAAPWGEGKSPSALSSLALAAGALAALSGRGAVPTQGADAAVAIDPAAPPAQMSKQAASVFAQVAIAIATGDKEAIMSGAAAGAAASAAPAPAAAPKEPASLIQPVKPLIGSSCDTRAGTKFCSVGGG